MERVIIYFLVYFLISFSLYKVFFAFKKRKDDTALFNIMEIKHLIQGYKLDIKRIGIKKVVNIVSLTNAFIFTCALTVLQIFKLSILVFLIVFVLILTLTYILYYLMGKYYQKKGMIINV